MTETTSPPSLTREKAVALAEWMGWKITADPAEIGHAVAYGPPTAFFDVDGRLGVTGHHRGAWNPLTDANADVRVLQRAREVGGPGMLVWVDAWLTREARRRWGADPSGPDALSPSLMCLLYLQTGDYTRAVLSIISPEADTPS